MRIKVGFFTATHLEVDAELKKRHSCEVVLWERIYNAPGDAVAALKAKQDVDIEMLKAEYTRRWGKPIAINYTTQRMAKVHTRTWMRSFIRIKFSDLERIQRGELTIGERTVEQRIGRK